MVRPLNASFAGGGDGVTAFLRDLRALRGQAGLKHGELAKRAHFPEDTLKSAEHGPDLPTLPVLEAYVRGCGASPADWEDRWRRLTTGAALELSLPGRAPSAARRPGAAGEAPLASAPAPVPSPRSADHELASRVVAGLDAYPLTAGPAQVQAYQPFAPQAPMTARVPMTAPVPGLAQMAGTAPAPGTAPASAVTPGPESAWAPGPAHPSPTASTGTAEPAAQPPAPGRRPGLRRTRMIIVLIVAIILAAAAVVWLARPAAGVPHRTGSAAPVGAAVPADGEAPASTVLASAVLASAGPPG